MKRLLLIVLTLLTATAYAWERPFFFKQSDNPSSRAEWFYSTWNFRVDDHPERGGIERFTVFQLNWHKPTRSGLGYYVSSTLHLEDRKTQTIGGMGVSYRLSSIVYTGLDIEAGWLEESDEAMLCFHPGITVKPSGNLQFGFHDRYTRKLDSGDSDNLFSASASLIFNRHFTTRFSWDTDNTLDTELLGDLTGGGICLYAGASLDADGPFDDAMYRAGLSVQFEGFFAQYGETTGTKDRESRELRMAFMSGPFTPPVRFEPKHYAIVKTPRQYKTLGILSSVDDFQPSETEITIASGDNLTRISRNLPPGADPAYRDNVKAIAEYNNLADPSRIYVGQKIRIPILKPEAESVIIPMEDRSRIEELLEMTYSTRVVETSINSALWAFRLEGLSSMRERLPSHSLLDNPYLLDAQALSQMYSGSYEEAEKLLQWALNERKTSPILRANLIKAMQLLQRSDEEIEAVRHPVEDQDANR